MYDVRPNIITKKILFTIEKHLSGRQTKRYSDNFMHAYYIKAKTGTQIQSYNQFYYYVYDTTKVSCANTHVTLRSASAHLIIIGDSHIFYLVFVLFIYGSWDQSG